MEPGEGTSSGIESLLTWLLTKGRHGFLAAIILLSAGFAPFAFRVPVERNGDSMVSRSGAERRADSEFRRNFGGEETLLTVTHPRVLEPDGLRLVGRLTEQAGGLKGVSRVYSLTNAMRVVSGPAGAETAPLVPRPFDRPENRGRILSALADNPRIGSLLISPDRRPAAITIETGDRPGDRPSRDDLIPTLRRIIDRNAGEAKLHLSGISVLYSEWLRLSGHPGDRIRLIVRETRTLFAPCLYTALTTAIGLLSLPASDTPAVRQFGVFGALGVLISFAASIALVPLALSFLPLPGQGHPAPEARSSPGILQGAARLAGGHPSRILATALLLAAAAVVGITRIRNNTDLVRFLKTSAPLYRDTIFIDRNLAGVYPLEMLVSRKDGRPLTAPGDIRRIAAFQEMAARQEHVADVYSIADPIRLVNRAETGGKTRGLPETEDDLLYDFDLMQADREQSFLGKLMTKDLTAARISIRVHAIGTAAAAPLIRTIEEKGKELFGDSYSLVPTGGFYQITRKLQADDPFSPAHRRHDVGVAGLRPPAPAVVPRARGSRKGIEALHQDADRGSLRRCRPRRTWRVVAEIRKKELASWPPDREGHDDALKSIDAILEARSRIQERFPARRDRGDRRQKMLIEFILSDKASIVAISEPELEEGNGRTQIVSKRPIVVLELSRTYVRGDIYEIARDALRLGREESQDLLEPLLPPESGGDAEASEEKEREGSHR